MEEIRYLAPLLRKQLKKNKPGEMKMHDQGSKGSTQKRRGKMIMIKSSLRQIDMQCG